MNQQSDPKKKEEKPQPKWEKRGFTINKHMEQVCRLGIAATTMEIASLKRKLEKLQYGS